MNSMILGYVFPQKATLLLSEFEQNKGYEGGAIFVTAAVDLMISNCTFNKNFGNFSGGAISIMVSLCDSTAYLVREHRKVLYSLTLSSSVEKNVPDL